MLAIYFTADGKERTVSMKRVGLEMMKRANLEVEECLLEDWLELEIQDCKDDDVLTKEVDVSYVLTDAKELHLLRYHTVDLPGYFEEDELWIAAKSRDDLLEAARYNKVPEEHVRVLAESGAAYYTDPDLAHDLQIMRLQVDSSHTYVK